MIQKEAREVTQIITIVYKLDVMSLCYVYLLSSDSHIEYSLFLAFTNFFSVYFHI